jgi:uncharacterized membrane protein
MFDDWKHVGVWKAARFIQHQETTTWVHVLGRCLSLLLFIRDF